MTISTTMIGTLSKPFGRARAFALATLVAVGAVTGATSAHAAGGYPLYKPIEVEWTFSGLFGYYDKQQLQRGFQVYREICASCHSMDYVAFRNLSDLGYSEDQIRALAAEYEITDPEPNDEGEIFTRAGLPKDYFPSPWANPQEGAYLNNGAYPPDFSTLAKARAVERGFPTFITDIFTGYAESGPDYIYSLMLGYTIPKEQVEQDYPELAEVEIADTAYFNPYFIAGPALAMPQQLYGDDVTYADGTEATIEQQAADISAFMMWASEPTLTQRKQLGFVALIFLLVFGVLMYFVKQRVWADEAH